jgi:hypothetical protein
MTWKLLPLPREGEGSIYDTGLSSYFKKENLFVGLPAASDNSEAPWSWDWKGGNVDRLNTEYTLDVFSAQSVTPDTTLILAGPPRLAEGGKVPYHPIGLITGVQYNQDNQLRPVWELGSDVTYFTRGKTISSLNISKMLAHQSNLIRALTKEAAFVTEDTAYAPTTRNSAGSGNLWLNIASAQACVPFGIMVIFRTKADAVSKDTDEVKSFLEAVYLENCNIANLSLGINSSDLVLQENIQIMFDRAVPVDLGE